MYAYLLHDFKPQIFVSGLAIKAEKIFLKKEINLVVLSGYH